ncbi:Uma2 family endonuclease [Lusitaniella coriacea LEGE 07157]|uniref:Uma2 family endonuclease n=1 Tax=Lusitaniella coriacea LEGE 07157 TaxID=945747 RepID=A0A8J7AY58_9CYAN|nr:Uma2 family endonuclease [Lusitaniella coriacea]MBE9114839.1 Uma2 family endonuclease [Lusitaniella coriacea LEGE 07157]
MTSTINPSNLPKTLPDHTQLPESDGTFVENFQEHPQSILLTDSIKPIFQALHPDEQYCIGQDCGIYWRMVEPPERGHFPITPLGVELGIWQGQYQNVALPWLRWWDNRGNLLLTGDERAERAESQTERLREQLRAAEIEPNV